MENCYLEEYYPTRNEMITSCQRVIDSKCKKTRTVQSGVNYFQIACKSSNCQFMITYSQRCSNRSPFGYYIIKSKTNLCHSSNCMYDINNSDSKLNEIDSLINLIIPLFDEENPSIYSIRKLLESHGYNDLSNDRLKYVKRLAKTKIFEGSKDNISQLVHYIKTKLKEEGWTYDLEFSNGFLVTIMLFSPYAPQLIKYYGNPYVVDATFSSEKLRLHSMSVVDGEGLTQIIGLVIRPTEDTHGYRILFEYIKQFTNDHITIISDQARCIGKAASNVFCSKNDYDWMWCIHHIRELIDKKCSFVPDQKLWSLLIASMSGEIAIEKVYHEFLNAESYHDITCKTTDFLFSKISHLAPSMKSCRRGNYSSQREEMVNSVMKKNGKSALEMIKSIAKASKNWFQSLISRNYDSDKSVTIRCSTIMDSMMLKAIKRKFDYEYHEIIDGKCTCDMLHEIGIPCPGIIHYYQVNGLNNDDLYKLVTHQYQLSNYFDFLADIQKPMNESSSIPPRIIKNFEISGDDLLYEKIKWIHRNNEKFHQIIDKLVKDAEEEIVIPPFCIVNKSKQNQKRIKSSVEIAKGVNQRLLDKFDINMINILKAYLPNGKLMKKELLRLAKNLMGKSKEILPIQKRNPKKSDILIWFQQNWDKLSYFLIPNIK